MKDKYLPLKCPSCESHLKVKQLFCDSCETEVAGLYALPMLSQLSRADQKFILAFVRSSGSLKVMAQQMKLSYPTVRNLLDEIIERVNKLEKDE